MREYEAWGCPGSACAHPATGRVGQGGEGCGRTRLWTLHPPPRAPPAGSAAAAAADWRHHFRRRCPRSRRHKSFGGEMGRFFKDLNAAPDRGKSFYQQERQRQHLASLVQAGRWAQAPARRLAGGRASLQLLYQPGCQPIRKASCLATIGGRHCHPVFSCRPALTLARPCLCRLPALPCPCPAPALPLHCPLQACGAIKGRVCGAQH
jgi:hypothetical protein